MNQPLENLGPKKTLDSRPRLYNGISRSKACLLISEVLSPIQSVNPGEVKEVIKAGLAGYNSTEAQRVIERNANYEYAIKLISDINEEFNHQGVGKEQIRVILQEAQKQFFVSSITKKTKNKS